MSRTSVSRSSSAAAALRAGRRRRPGAGPVAVGAGPDRDLVAPPELARDAPVGCVLERVDREAVLALGVVADAPGARAPRSPARPSSSIAHHHCGETSGSIREWQRSQVRDRVADRLSRFRAGRAPSSQATTRSLGLLLGQALEALGGHRGRRGRSRSASRGRGRGRSRSRSGRGPG